MDLRVMPMIHVPDVRATAEWYQSIGFSVLGTNVEDGEMDWAMLAFGEGKVMFSAGGRLSNEDRREVDLYVRLDGIEDMYKRLRERLEIREELHDTFYGMREFIVRDLNGFWVTFGEVIES
jgi:uncharacterized glyoxalase superfamily protein PhnB